ncbi:MAG: hypothetical protein AVDCRST_MAG91-3088, partial [uncultured Sphingomonadaceae bacterium]
AGGEQDAELGEAAHRFLRKAEPVHPARHDHVREQEIDAVSVAFENGQRLLRVGRRQHRVTVRGQILLRERQHVRAVVHRQDGARAVRRGRADDVRRGDGFLHRSRALNRHGQDQPHGGAAAGLAVDLHASVRLLGETVHHGEAEAGPLALALGGEEGFHRPVTDMRRHPLALVGDGERHIVARREAAVPGRALVERQRARGDRHHAASRHRVARVDEDVEQRDLQVDRIDRAGRHALA